MSSSLLEILALMEQALKEQKSSTEDEKDESGIGVFKKGSRVKKVRGKAVRPESGVLDVGLIVNRIYDTTRKAEEVSISKGEAVTKIRELNSTNVKAFTTNPTSRTLLDALRGFFEVPSSNDDECKSISNILGKTMINKAYEEMLSSFDATTAGFENERFVAFLLGGETIPTGMGDIADVKVGNVGISLKTKSSGIQGSYRDLLNTLGIKYVYYPNDNNIATNQSDYTLDDYNKNSAGMPQSNFSSQTPLAPKYTNLFYVFYQRRKDDKIAIYAVEVDEGAVTKMVGNHDKDGNAYYDADDILYFNKKALEVAQGDHAMLRKDVGYSGDIIKGLTGFKQSSYTGGEVDIKGSMSKQQVEEGSLKAELTRSLNILNMFVGRIVDDITTYSFSPTVGNLENVQKSLASMSRFEVQQHNKCSSDPSNSQQPLQEAFSVSIDDLEKGGYAKDRNQTEPHPAKIKHDVSMLDNRDLDEFFKRATNKFLSDGTVKQSGLNSVSWKLSQLIVVADAVPEDVRQEYLNDLSDTINKLYNHWMVPERIKTSKQIIGTITNAIKSSNNEQLKQIADDRISTAQAELEAQAEKEQEAGQVSITSPTFKTSRLPGNLEDYNAVMARMFGESDSLRARIEDLKKLAVFFGKPEEEFKQATEEMNPLDFFARVVMMDYLVEIAKGFDSTAGRYLLEYLLAVVAKGRVTGADLGDSGMAGAVDFQSEGGFGSSKFLSSYEDALQSVKAFTDGQTVTYVVAVRQGKPTKLKTRAPSPLELQGIKMHIFDITKTKNTFKIEVIDVSGQKKIINIGIKKYKKSFSLTDEKDNITHLNIGKIAEANRSNAFTIPLVFTTEEGTKTYRQMMSTSLGETKKELLTIVKDLFDGLKKADTMSRKYVVTGDPDDGGAAFDSLDNSLTNLASLSGFVGEESEFMTDITDTL